MPGTETAASGGARQASREMLARSVGSRLEMRDFRACIAPLGRLLMELGHRDPERAVLGACLAVAYAETGRQADAERALLTAARIATTSRGVRAVNVARSAVHGG